MKPYWLAVIFLVTILAACTTSDNISNRTAAYQFNEAGFMQHVRVLSSDAYAGREPATEGGRLTVDYLESAFRELGLEPAFTDTGYRQPVELMVITADPAMSLSIGASGAAARTLEYKQDMMAWTRKPIENSALNQSDLVFVGYGIVAPEYDWNDYAGVDMTGKTAVILVNDPGFASQDDALFNGKAMTYYGRWTYKYEEAARQGAAGAIVVHQTDAAGYPWGVVSGGWSGPQYHLLDPGEAPLVDVEGWIQADQARAVFADAGEDFDRLAAQAAKPGFRPVVLDSKADIKINNTLKQAVSHNVGALIPGRARADEVFVFTAHWDHLGVDASQTEGDNIYNGAVDNATGTAALLEIARGFMSQATRPERSILFLAVTAEESGLLGSAAYAADPAFPMHDTVAGINIDAMNVYGATNDVVVVGWDASELQEYLARAASDINRELMPEPTPEKGFYYRSDHFNFAKKGVPMIYAEAGIDVIGKGETYGRKMQADYVANHYHKPSDEITSDWDTGGIAQDLGMLFQVANEIVNNDDWPEWREGNEFRAIREASLKRK